MGKILDAFRCKKPIPRASISVIGISIVKFVLCGKFKMLYVSVCYYLRCVTF